MPWLSEETEDAPAGAGESQEAIASLIAATAVGLARAVGYDKGMSDDDQQKLDDLDRQVTDLCSRINATAAGPEREELRSKLAALDRVRFLLWQDTHSDETQNS